MVLKSVNEKILKIDMKHPFILTYVEYSLNCRMMYQLGNQVVYGVRLKLGILLKWEEGLRRRKCY